MTDLQLPPVPRRRRQPSAAPAVASSASVLADVVERMAALFAPELSLPTIARVVRHCRRDLEIMSGRSHAEELERLAYARLLRLASRAN